MSAIDLRTIIEDYPECVSNGAKLKAILSDLYSAAPRALLNTLCLTANCGVAAEIKTVSQITPIEVSRWQNTLESEYGLARNFIDKSLNLWISVFWDKLQDGQLAKKRYTCKDLSDFEIQDHVLVKYTGNKSNITIPDTVERIASQSFSGNANIEYVLISGNVNTVEAHAFINCTHLFSVAFADGVRNIKKGAFINCNRLERVYISRSVTVIEPFAFWGCGALKEITVNDENYFYRSIDGNLLTKSGKAFIRCVVNKNEQSFSMPYGVTFVEIGAFNQCKNLTEILVRPDNISLQSIEGNLYAKLKKILLQYASGKKNQTFIIPAGVQGIGHYSVAWSENLTEIVIPQSVTWIGEGAFLFDKNIKKITIAEGLKTIGDAAFQHCDALQSVELPKSLVHIGDSAFRYCRKLERLIIHEGVFSIGEHAFDECENLWIEYHGTIAQWHKICENIVRQKNEVYTVQCIDGTIRKLSKDAL